MVVVAGVTVELARVDVRAASEYQVRVPLEQVALKLELLPLQIVLGDAVTLVGVLGVVVTLTVTLALALFVLPTRQAA